MAESVQDLTIPYDELAQPLYALQGQALLQAITDLPFTYTVETAQLFLSFITLFILDEPQGTINIAAVSQNEGYRQAVQGYNFDPATFHIKLSDSKSTIAKAIRQAESLITDDWDTLARPQSSGESARINQASVGVTYSAVCPLLGIKPGALMYNYTLYQGALGTAQVEFMQHYTELVAAVLDGAAT